MIAKLVLILANQTAQIWEFIFLRNQLADEFALSNANLTTLNKPTLYN